MPRLIISQKKKGKLNFSIPHYILINGKMLGLMKDPSVTIEVPPATFEVRIQSMFKWFYSAAVVTMHEETDTYIEFTDRAVGQVRPPVRLSRRSRLLSTNCCKTQRRIELLTF